MQVYIYIYICLKRDDKGAKSFKGVFTWFVVVEDKTRYRTNLTLALVDASISNRGVEKFDFQTGYHCQPTATHYHHQPLCKCI